MRYEGRRGVLEDDFDHYWCFNHDHELEPELEREGDPSLDLTLALGRGEAAVDLSPANSA